MWRPPRGSWPRRSASRIRLPEPVVAQPAPARAPAINRIADAPTDAHDSREYLIVEAMRAYQGGWTRRGRPRLKELRDSRGSPTSRAPSETGVG